MSENEIAEFLDAIRVPVLVSPDYRPVLDEYEAEQRLKRRGIRPDSELGVRLLSALREKVCVYEKTVCLT